MAGRYGLNAHLDIEQILLEAQHRWLRPAEICEILRNYKKFQIAPEPPNRPPSGSIFLFDKKVLRYFRKDGHNWRKKRDGKTVKEAHERLKAGSIDVLHCYYAHGEENENFQRRSYWMLEEELSHIVLVHYREVTGTRTNFNRLRETEAIPIPDLLETEDVPHSEVDSSVSSRLHPYDHQVTSQFTDTTSHNSVQASDYEDAESVYNHNPCSGFRSYPDLHSSLMEKVEDGLSTPYYPVPNSNDYQSQFSSGPDINFPSVTLGKNVGFPTDTGFHFAPSRNLGFSPWENVVESGTDGYQSVHFQSSVATQSGMMGSMHGEGNIALGQALSNDLSKFQEYESRADGPQVWQNNDEQLIITDVGSSFKPDIESNRTIEFKAEHSTMRQPLLDGVRRESLKKLDSFDRWVSKELDDVDETHMQSNSDSYWETLANGDSVNDSTDVPQVQLDSYMLSPSLSMDQFFSIIDFSPSWAYAGSQIKVLVTGRFLKSPEELKKCKWACMFGELEVPAEVISNGVLRCHTPARKVGRVPFYVTCSNRLACSEVREFEFRTKVVQDVDVTDLSSGSSIEGLLHTRFVKLLSLGPVDTQDSVYGHTDDILNVCDKINSILKDDDEWEQMLYLNAEDEFSAEKVKDQLLQKLLKKKLRLWLLQKVAEGGKGANVLDEGGQGVLHFAAALGYDWAIQPTVVAGVSVNFRDVNGWTALHWAASFGRERTVAFLISLGAVAGALSDPSPKHPSGRTPADLASSNGHKGIAAYLAESAVISHLSLINLKGSEEGGSGEVSVIADVQTVSDRNATPVADGDMPYGLSLKDSLAAVRNATEAVARIHQAFRVQSFQRKQLQDCGDGELGLSEESALSLLAVKTNRSGQHHEPGHAAAIRIQNKFRSWKGRKNFLLIRQRVIKIQAHVRGHQVRKNYRKIIWSVGILDKVILRWRRKGSGLRGFKPETLPESSSMQIISSKDDDYDFLKEGRKQTEERLQKALARVKSMVQYPEARDQYRRLLNVVSEMQETRNVYDRVLNSSDEAIDVDDDLIDFGALLDDDTFMETG